MWFKIKFHHENENSRPCQVCYCWTKHQCKNVIRIAPFINHIIDLLFQLKNIFPQVHFEQLYNISVDVFKTHSSGFPIDKKCFVQFITSLIDDLSSFLMNVENLPSPLSPLWMILVWNFEWIKKRVYLIKTRIRIIQLWVEMTDICCIAYFVNQ